MNLGDGAKVLDFGSGPGFLIRNLIDLGIGKRLYAFDQSPLAQAELLKLEVTMIEDSKNPEANQYDLIIANHVIEHLEDPISTIEDFVSWLQPNGKLLIGTPDFLSPSALLFRDRYRMLHEPTHISLFSLDSLLRMLRHYGLTVINVSYPFWQSPYFNESTLNKMLTHEKQSVSPPFVGNFLLVVAQKLGK